MSAALEYRSATIGYAGTPVVREADLSVAEGEFVGLVGPNGAGKSTLLRAVTGSAQLLGGALRVLDEDIDALDPRTRARVVGVLPQSLPSLAGFAARAFVEMGRHPHLGRLEALGERDAEVIQRAMELTDTARFAETPVTELSGGDLQRLVLAQTLAQEPRVLLLDEPTSHLDLNHRLQVLDLVRELASSGIAVLGVFHDLDLAARYSDRLGIVNEGRLAPPQRPEAALDAAVISDVFGVQAVVRPDPVTGAPSVTPVVRRAELAPPGASTVGLVCGSGSGAALMRRFALDGYRLTCGALNRGDIDQAVADALHAERVELPPFGSIDAADEARVRAAYASARAIVVCATPFGGANVANLRAAVEAERPLVFVGGWSEQRDFTGGEAAALVRRALAQGALVVSDDTAAAAAVRVIVAAG